MHKKAGWSISTQQPSKAQMLPNDEYWICTCYSSAGTCVTGRYRCYLQHLWWFYTLFMADSSSSNSVLYYSSSISLFTKYGDTQLPGILELILFWQQGYQVTKVTRLSRLQGYQVIKVTRLSFFLHTVQRDKIINIKPSLISARDNDEAIRTVCETCNAHEDASNSAILPENQELLPAHDGRLSPTCGPDRQSDYSLRWGFSFQYLSFTAKMFLNRSSTSQFVDILKFCLIRSKRIILFNQKTSLSYH